MKPSRPTFRTLPRHWWSLYHGFPNLTTQRNHRESFERHRCLGSIPSQSDLICRGCAWRLGTLETPQVILTCPKFGNHWSVPLTKQSAETKHYTPSALFPSLRLPRTVRAGLCLEDVPHSSSLSRRQPLRTSCPSDTLSLSWDTILRMPGVGFTVSLITLSDSFRGTCHCLKLSSFDKWRRRRAERLAHTPRASGAKLGLELGQNGFLRPCPYLETALPQRLISHYQILSLPNLFSSLGLLRVQMRGKKNPLGKAS